MGLRVDGAVPFFGSSVGDLHRLLRAWPATCDLSAAARRSGLAPMAAAALLDEADAQGLVEMSVAPEGGRKLSVSDRAKSFAQAVDGPPMSNADARRRLSRVLARVSEWNAGSARVPSVEQVWLFGSLATGSDAVGDIDLGFVHRLPPAALEADAAEWLRVNDEVVVSVDAEATEPRARVSSFSDLLGMACPCRCVFDSRRGGPVWDDLLPRHPQALATPVPATVTAPLPELRGEGTLVPSRPALPVMSAPDVRKALGIRVRSSLELGMLDAVLPVDPGMYPDCDPSFHGASRAAAWLDALPPVDGRTVSVLQAYYADAPEPGGECEAVMVRRAFEREEPGSYRYCLKVRSVLTSPAGLGPASRALLARLAYIGALDVERLWRHAGAAGGSPRILVDVGHEMKRGFEAYVLVAAVEMGARSRLRVLESGIASPSREPERRRSLVS